MSGNTAPSPGSGDPLRLFMGSEPASGRVLGYFCIKTSNISDQGLFTQTIIILCQIPM
jgi:hypothetical protein